MKFPSQSQRPELVTLPAITSLSPAQQSVVCAEKGRSEVKKKTQKRAEKDKQTNRGRRERQCCCSLFVSTSSPPLPPFPPLPSFPPPTTFPPLFFLPCSEADARSTAFIRDKVETVQCLHPRQQPSCVHLHQPFERVPAA